MSHTEAPRFAVWPCAQDSAQRQRAGRYLPASNLHPAKMLPELARRITNDYSHDGDLVVDPMCGIGTTLVEAALAGRRAIGVELEPRWSALAQANLAHAGADTKTVDVRQGDARQLTAILADVAGTVDLVVVSPPYGCDVSALDTHARTGRELSRANIRNYSPTRANIGHARGERYRTEMTAVYAGCHDILRPGGRLVTVTKNTRRTGQLLDLAALTTTLARHVGFRYDGHVIALLAAVRDGSLFARPSFWQRRHAHWCLDRAVPYHLTVHEDVLIFVKPEGPVADAAAHPVVGMAAPTRLVAPPRPGALRDAA